MLKLPSHPNLAMRSYVAFFAWAEGLKSLMVGYQVKARLEALRGDGLTVEGGLIGLKAFSENKVILSASDVTFDFFL